MIRHVVLSTAIALYSSSALAQLQLPPEDKSIEAIGFECADNARTAIPLLGRGDNFPAFLLQDVERELKRQHASSELIKAECTAQSEVHAHTLELDDGSQVLSKLQVIFPMAIEVQAGKNRRTIRLNIRQEYTAENLETEKNRKVTQKFVVLK